MSRIKKNLVTLILKKFDIILSCKITNNNIKKRDKIMAIPDYQTIMLPLLSTLSDKKTYTNREIIELLSNRFKLSDNERKKLLPSGQQLIFDNRVAWARTYLKKAGLLETQKRGTQRITDRGLDVLKENRQKLDVKYLERFPEFLEFRKSPTKEKIKAQQNIIKANKTPEEILEDTFSLIKDNLAEELLEKIKKCSPEFFEKLVVDLIVSMGYGGSIKDAGQAIGKTSDGGIDGIVKEDRLGLDIIYIQAKRWANTVPIKEIRDFAGALLSKKAKKGIFITTSGFAKNAFDFVNSIEPKIILMDGNILSNLMIEYEVGANVYKHYKISKIDIDYFEQ